MEDRQANHRNHRYKRERSYSRATARRQRESDQDSYRDRDRRGENAQEQKQYDRPPRSHYSGNSRSCSPRRPYSHGQRSTSPYSSKGPKQPIPYYKDRQHRSKRSRPSTPPFLSGTPRFRDLSHSPTGRGRRRSHSHRREIRERSTSSTRRAIPSRRSGAPLPSQQAAYNGEQASPSTTLITTEKQKPDFAPSGLLAAETNTVANTAIILKYNEPPEARLPPVSARWRLYVFKGTATLDTLPLHTRSCWLFGRESAVVDYVTEHPSCSKQHAVVQFRYVEKKDEFGERMGNVKPYVLDLESANGTRVNGEVVPERRYVELMSGDVLKFGDSTREYVLILPPKD
ncbi:hypothetical protein MMC26_006558 [Xylographa opegraphella]|nr:hypothetical protein [Xylographa opegraphella]